MTNADLQRIGRPSSNLFYRIILPRWSDLRRVGNSPSVRLTVLIPLVGYLVIFNARVVHYLELVKEFVGLAPADYGLSVSPRLLLIYFGLCALAGGSIVYSIFCPEEVKHYGTSPAYVGGDGRNIGDIAFEPIEAQLRESKHYKQQYKTIRDRFDPRTPAPRSAQDERAEHHRGTRASK